MGLIYFHTVLYLVTVDKGFISFYLWSQTPPIYSKLVLVPQYQILGQFGPLKKRIDSDTLNKQQTCVFCVLTQQSLTKIKYCCFPHVFYSINKAASIYSGILGTKCLSFLCFLVLPNVFGSGRPKDCWTSANQTFFFQAQVKPSGGLVPAGTLLSTSQTSSRLPASTQSGSQR